jgi:hypothetical protein
MHIWAGVGSGESSHRCAEQDMKWRRLICSHCGQLVREPDMRELLQQVLAADMLTGKR